MILEFIAKINNISYNIKLAKLFGINSAIFLSILIDFQFSQKEKDSEYIKLSRKEIYDLCGIEEDIQIKTEENLRNYNLIEVVPFKNSSIKNYYKLNLDQLLHILTEENEKIEEELNRTYELFKKATKPPKTVSKRAAIINNLKKAVYLEDEESNNLIKQWIDEVMTKTGYLSKAAVEYMCSELLKYAGQSIIKLREVCKVAARVAYKEPKWVIKVYQDQIEDTTNNLKLNEVSQAETDENIKQLQQYKGETF